MATPDADEMEHFQRLSDQYQANLPGPLIGDKRSLSELVTEYAQADPTYVLKTTALAATHSAYRPIKGDGQCGWRGVVFAYFEILLTSGDLDLIVQEKVRLQSFEQTMRAVGIDYDIIVDMFEYTWDLFDDIHKAIGRGDRSESVLIETMNDENKSNSIVYHIKMMTSSFMQLQPDRYEPFLETPIAEYRLTRIDPANQEIDHIGLQALTDAVIAPACIAVEVSYLDRSTGDEVTPHSFVLDSQNWPAIRLIYRPGHYDLIYKDNKPVQVFLQSHNPPYVSSYSTEEFRGDEESLNMTSYLFPGSNDLAFHGLPTTTYPSNNMTLSINHKQPSHIPFPPTTMAQPSYFSPALQPTCHRQQPTRSQSLPAYYYSAPVTQPQAQFPSSPQSPQSPSPVTPNANFAAPSKISKGKEPQIRMNENCFKYEVRRHETIPLDPGSFGTSALSQAHFTNSDFQPQMWNAEQEYGRHDS